MQLLRYEIAMKSQPTFERVWPGWKHQFLWICGWDIEWYKYSSLYCCHTSSFFGYQVLHRCISLYFQFNLIIDSESKLKYWGASLKNINGNPDMIIANPVKVKIAFIFLFSRYVRFLFELFSAITPNWVLSWLNVVKHVYYIYFKTPRANDHISI